MHNQTPTVGTINPAFTGPHNELDQKKTSMGQPAPPPYQPNPEYQVPSTNPNLSGYPNHPYGVPGGPQGPYTQQPLQGTSAYPQVAYVGQTGMIIKPTVVVMPMVAAAPDYIFYSIFTMLCCCLPLGIAAVVFSCNTRNANLAGQRELAMSSSKVAFILNNVALGLGLTMLTVLSIGLYITYRHH
ncbi:synapse differentiation-inducing gene protein 1-like [Labeo rohita]|uniref:Synapse differentiation-inducing gene protein 1-like n=1 Tax=Labeo rohita TaxID=84645 RepID=A0A498LIA1_LABRO|nr:synapse differentiation-inducing gene protein 1-like [Labeo rohita]RXN23043.1 synapse differentiation-inducing gene protein 1-like [Labeo rohita]